MLVVGLTGGIGSGKSTVAELFARLGAAVVDTDAISHRLTQAGGTAIPGIRTEFGAEFISADGALNRGAMRTLIFSTPDARQRLEQLLHPLILTQARAELSQASAPYALLVVPLLAESPAFRQLVQRILVVDCPETLQIERVVRRSGLSADEVNAIIASQTPRTERLRIADDILENDAGTEALAAHVATLHQGYLQNTD